MTKTIQPEDNDPTVGNRSRRHCREDQPAHFTQKGALASAPLLSARLITATQSGCGYNMGPAPHLNRTLYPAYPV